MSKRKLLLADDSITIQKVVNLTFADEGIDVTAVGDGNAAMEKFVESMPDLVMVDVNMPGFDGYRICEMIKQDDETKHIPVILLVGSFEPFDEEEAHRVGADDYLTKPFQSIRQLVGKVTALLDAASGKIAANENAAVPVNNNAEAISGNSGENISYPTSNSAAALWGATDDAVQTTQIGSLPVDETQKFSSDFAGAEFSQTPEQLTTSDYETEQKDRSKTQPLDAAELTEIHSIEGIQTDDAESANENVYEFADDASSKENLNIDSESSEQDVSSEQTFAERENFDERQFSVQDSADESETAATGTFSYAEIDETDLLEVPFSEDDDEFYDFEDETIEEVKLTSDETEDTPTESSKTEISDMETSEAVEEIQPDEEVYAQSHETQPDEETEDAAASPEAPETEYSQSENSQPEYPQSDDAQAEYSQPINMSPEFIDAIAAKVVEKLSDTLVREIARETAAQTADLIIQRITQGK
ncbi:MAG TPA: response regulator [Pyrinomonadaceae bacterium]|nr:response regulator [Pyrinomonadaceae bacterium]